MNAVWVLVCDAASARFFEIRDDDPSWHLVSAVSHPESRSKASALVSDHAGRRSSQGRTVHHNALAPASSPQEVAKGHFAHSLAQTLDTAMRAARFHRWVLVAPPHFLGLLQHELTPQLRKHLSAAVNKEMTHLSAHDLADGLRGAVETPLDPPDDTARAPLGYAH